jgi:hypothetical protein
MKTLTRSLPVLLFALACTGCDKFDGLGDIRLDGSVDRAEIQLEMENSQGLATIKEIRVLWDGELIRTAANPAPVGQSLVLATRYVSVHGRHVLSIQMADQTSSPNTYTVTRLSITSYDEGHVDQTLSLPPRTAELRTEESISYDFQL